MQSKAATVQAYLASLPDDRRAALAAVRKVILANLDRDYEEGMQYGGIGYYVPHRVFPAGYHCDPKQPLPFAGLASQKNHMSIYIGCVETSESKRFREAWAKSGKKLDMGKACVRFRKLDDLALDVIGDAIRRMPAKQYVAHYQESRAASGGLRSRTRVVKPGSKGSAAKPARSGKTATGKSSGARTTMAGKRSR